MIQALFCIIFYFVAIPIYNGMLIMGYATFYTSLPVFSLVCDSDCSKQAVMQYPPLYATLQKGRSLSFKTFLIWFWKSIYQAAVIMLGTILFFQDSFTNIVTITFSALIITELLNVYSSVSIYKLQKELTSNVGAQNPSRNGLHVSVNVIYLHNFDRAAA